MHEQLRRIGRSLVHYLSVGIVVSVYCGVLTAQTFLSRRDALEAYNAGEYVECLEMCAQAIEGGRRDEDWLILQLNTLAAVGRVEEAAHLADVYVERNRTGIRLRLAAHDAYTVVGDRMSALRALAEIERALQSDPLRYSSASNLVAVGRFFLLQGEDPKQVLEVVFDRAAKSMPRLKDVYLAAGGIGPRGPRPG